MSTVIARRVASTPVRSAVDTWSAIIDIIAPDPADSARGDLVSVKGVAASLISSEATGEDPIVVYDGGPRLRVYCVFGDDAVGNDDLNEDPVHQSVTGQGWKMSLPCPQDDLQWVQRKLATTTTRIFARAQGTPVADDEQAEKSSRGAAATAASSPTVNLKEFFRP